MTDCIKSFVGEEDLEPQSPECEKADAKPPRITGLGDVLALGAISFAGSLGFFLSPVLLATYLARRRKQHVEAATKELVEPVALGASLDDSHWDFGSVTLRHQPGTMPSLPKGCTQHVGYVRMSDGVSLAVNIMLPPDVPLDGSGPSVPCVIHCARYWRAWELRWPLRGLINSSQPYDFAMGNFKSELLLAGFAVLSADVRGAGASEGTMPFAWPDRETQDTLELVDYVAGCRGKAPGSSGGKQPWSDGRVALFGISYDGGAAVRAGARGHPAVQAVISHCVFGDIFRELFPGGIMNRWFLQEWCTVNYRLDNARLQDLHPMLPLIIKGCAPAGLRHRHNRAVAKHKDNWDLMSKAAKIQFIDDEVMLDNNVEASVKLLDCWSKHVSEFRTCTEDEDESSTVMGALAAQDIPVMFISGWSCVTVGTAINAFAAHAKPEWRLLLGPWNHGCVQHVRHQKGGSQMAKFPMSAEITSFLLKHFPALPGDDAEPPEAPMPAKAQEPERVRVFIDGDRPSWFSSKSWPPQQLRKQPLWLQPDGELAWEAPTSSDADGESEPTVELPEPAGEGAPPLWAGTSRYFAMIKMTDLVNWKWILPSEAEEGRLLRFATPPLEKPASLLGPAVLSLRLRRADGAPGEAAASNADVFAHLCEIPAGESRPIYVTEGQLRLSHRTEREQPHHYAAGDIPVANDAATVAAADVGAGAMPFHSLLREDEASLEDQDDEGLSARLALLPVGHRFSKGSRILLLLTADDPVHFAANPGAIGRPPRLCVGAAEPSLLWLPLLSDA